jgi:thioesterase domain-containing protein
MRIEVAEIESIMYELSEVQNAAVVAKTRAGFDEPVLVAYLVLKPGQTIPIEQIRSYIAKKVPHYMIPAKYHFMEALPLNANGKIDKMRLPEPNWELTDTSKRYQPPRDEVERILADVWCDLLKIKSVGVFDDFFSIGGRSLEALRLMARIESLFGIKLPIQTLVDNPDIASLRGLIGAKGSNEIKRRTVLSLRENGESPAFFMVPGGARTAVSLMKMAMNIAPWKKLYALEYPGMDGHLEPMDNVPELAAFFVNEIKQIQPTGPYHLGGPCLGGVIAFEMAHQLQKMGDTVGVIALIDSTPPGLDYSDDEETVTRVRYFSKRVITSTRDGNIWELFKNFWKRFKRSRPLLKLRKRFIDNNEAISKTKQHDWLGWRLDDQSWKVFEKLQLAKRKYTSDPFSGSAIVILNSLAKGTRREKMWASLFSSTETFYIPNTSHSNIFELEESQTEIARIINQRLMGS